MKVLVACEFSGQVREAFRAKGHDAYSADLIETEIRDNEHHILERVEKVLADPDYYGKFDLMVAFPPCTYLAVSGQRWKGREEQTKEAVDFVKLLWDSYVPKIALENPVGRLSTLFRRPDQIIQPWQFGHGETKATCLWLKNLPKLKPTNIVEGRIPRVWLEPPSVDRWKNRARTLNGVALAMADQWG